jgi:hypothetical protein
MTRQLWAWALEPARAHLARARVTSASCPVSSRQRCENVNVETTCSTPYLYGIQQQQGRSFAYGWFSTLRRGAGRRTAKVRGQRCGRASLRPYVLVSIAASRGTPPALPSPRTTYGTMEFILVDILYDMCESLLFSVWFGLFSSPCHFWGNCAHEVRNEGHLTLT